MQLLAAGESPDRHRGSRDKGLSDLSAKPCRRKAAAEPE